MSFGEQANFTRLLRLTLGLVLVLPRASVRAEDVRQLTYDLRVDLPVTIGGALAYVTTEALKDQLAPAQCRLCGQNGFDGAVRDGWRWSNTNGANKASNWFGFGILPLGAFGGMALLAARDHAISGYGVDALVMGEAVALAADVNQLIKFSVGRERPFVHALPEAEKDETAKPSDNNLSFYSGHTSLAFSLAVSAGTVATMRNYRGAPYVWGIGIPLAAFTGYLRIAADRHYFTDVLVGAVMGSAIGFGVPWLFHRPKASAAMPTVGVSSSPMLMTLRWSH